MSKRRADSNLSPQANRLMKKGRPVLYDHFASSPDLGGYPRKIQAEKRDQEQEQEGDEQGDEEEDENENEEDENEEDENEEEYQEQYQEEYHGKSQGTKSTNTSQKRGRSVV